MYDDRQQVLGELRRRLTPEAGLEPSGVLPVPAPLAAALPRGGLTRGTVSSLRGSGATSLLFTLMAGDPAARPTGQSRPLWSAIVGMPDIGLLAATEFGIDLDRVVLIPDPGPDVLQVMSILIDGVDVLVVALPPAARPSPARLRVLTGRLRQRSSVVLSMGPWPGADLVLTARWTEVSGVGRGAGRLRDRQLEVDVGGRRAGRGSTALLEFRAGRASVQVVEPLRASPAPLVAPQPEPLPAGEVARVG